MKIFAHWTLSDGNAWTQVLFHPSYKRPLVSSWQQKEEEKNNNDQNENEQKKKHEIYLWFYRKGWNWPSE